MLFLLKNWKILSYGLAAITLAGLYLAMGHYKAKVSELEDEISNTKAQLESVTKNTKKVIYVKTKVASMPASAVVDELQAKFSRD